MKPLAFPNVGTALDHTTRVVKQAYLRTFRDLGVDISTEQWVVLDLLARSGDYSQAALAEGSYKDAPTVSRIIDKLAKKGWVERKRFPNDRRRHLVALTGAGAQVHEVLLPAVEQLREQTWAGLEEEDFGRLMELLGRIRENFGVG